MSAKPQKFIFFQMAMTLLLVFFSVSYLSFGWIAAVSKSFGDVGAGNIIGVGGSIGAVCVAALLTILVSIQRPLNSAARWPSLCLILLQTSVIWLFDTGTRFDGDCLSLMVYLVCICQAILSSIVVALECTRVLKISGTNFRLFRTFGSLGYALAALTNQFLVGEAWMAIAPVALILALLLRPRNQVLLGSKPTTKSIPKEKGGFVPTKQIWSLFGLSFLLAFCAAPFQAFGVIELRNQAGGLSWLVVLIVAEIAFLATIKPQKIGVVLRGAGLIWAIAYWMLSSHSCWGLLGAMTLIALACPMQTYAQAELHRNCENSKWEATAQGMISVAASLGGLVCSTFVSTWQTTTPVDVWKGAIATCVVVAPVVLMASSNRCLRSDRPN